MFELNQSQLDFCQSSAQNIRLLAPAGCGKTASLLHRCRELIRRARHKPRFLIVTFTKAATAELRERLDSEEHFQLVRGQATITTLNSYGWRRIRDQVSGARLLTTPSDRHFAMKNQLRPVWIGKQHIEQVAKKRGAGSRTLMTVMDNMKAMGFVHARHVNRELYQEHLDALQEQGLSWRIDEQFDLLTRIGVLDRPKRGDTDAPSASRRDFYDRFFRFWRDAVERLHEESTFTYEDQKYWNYLDMNLSISNDVSQPVLSGAARYNHILVDEFQDINPLDLNLIKSIAQRHRATLTIIGDDDQAIFEWRGATPEYILHPDQYFGTPFDDYQLQINYRSPKNIVELSQKLISNNKNRVDKQVVANKDSNAIIEVKETDSINERLRMVTDIVENSEDHYPGTVAVIGRLRRQLIPYQIYFVSDGAPFKTAIDLDVFNNEAFDGLVNLLEIWERSQNKSRISKVIDDVQSIYSFIRRWPLNTKSRYDLGVYLRESDSVNTVVEGVSALRYYTDPKISGKKTLKELHDIAIDFLSTTKISEALKIIDRDFDGLRFDQEKAESDVFFTDPPLAQLADIVEAEDMDVIDLIERIDAVKVQTEEYRRQNSEENDLNFDVASALERPLHLMTATRAKGKEFDTVILLDTVEGIWPHKRATDQREMEAERRLFYVAFTRARHRVVMLVSRETDSTSRFLEELGIE